MFVVFILVLMIGPFVILDICICLNISPFLLVCNSMIGLFVFPQTEIRGGFLSHKRTIHFRPSRQQQILHLSFSSTSALDQQSF